MKYLPLLSSIILFVASLFLPVFEGIEAKGMEALLKGWMGIAAIDPFLALPWLGNIAYVLAILLYLMKRKGGLLLATLAVIFGLFTFGIDELPYQDSAASADFTLDTGFYLWLASFVLLWLFLLLSRREAAASSR